MEFKFYDDPGVKLRTFKVDRELIEEIKVADKHRESETDSIVQKWAFIFEKLWYVGHMYIMTVGMVSILLCLSRQVLKPWPRLIYRSTFVGVVFTYGVSLLQNLNGAEPGFYALLPLVTFQNIIMAAVWIVTTPHTIKLMPFTLYSLLHVADTASEHHSTSKSRSRIAHGLSDELAPRFIRLMGYLDLWLLVELSRDCLLIRPGAVVSLIMFIFFYRIKLMYSPSTKDAFMHTYNIIDKYMTRKDTPKRPRELWIRLRNKLAASEVNSSELYKEDTEKAIEYANMFHSLRKRP